MFDIASGAVGDFDAGDIGSGEFQPSAPPGLPPSSSLFGSSLPPPSVPPLVGETGLPMYTVIITVAGGSLLVLCASAFLVRMIMQRKKRAVEPASAMEGRRSQPLSATGGGRNSPARRGVHAGVQIRWLKLWAKGVPAGMSTLDVMKNFIKPATEETFCRYVEIIAITSPGSVGKADAFASHTWRAPFRDLVAALSHVMSDDQYVWIDIFAVLQWNAEDGMPEELVVEKQADLDFAKVVKACDYFLLVGSHVEAVAQLDVVAARTHHVPAEAKQLSAFFRVWWCAGLAPALQGNSH